MGVRVSKFKFIILPYFVVFSILIMTLLCSSKMFIFWSILELKMFIFMVIVHNSNWLLKTQKSTQVMGSSSVITYFLFQSLGSILFLMGIVLMHKYFIILISLIMKVGVFPVYWWVIEVGMNLDKFSLWLMLTVGKIGMLYFFSWLISIFSLIPLLLLKMAVALIGMLKSLNKFKLMLIFSSLLDTSLMIFLLKFSSLSGMSYFIIYALLLGLTLIYMTLSKFNKMSVKKINGLNLLLVIISLLGMPPLLGFLYKFMFLINSFSYLKVSLVTSIISLVFMFSIFFQCLAYFMFFMKSVHYALVMKFLKEGKVNSLIVQLIPFSLLIPLLMYLIYGNM